MPYFQASFTIIELKNAFDFTATLMRVYRNGYFFNIEINIVYVKLIFEDWKFTITENLIVACLLFANVKL